MFWCRLLVDYCIGDFEDVGYFGGIVNGVVVDVVVLFVFVFV